MCVQGRSRCLSTKVRHPISALLRLQRNEQTVLQRERLDFFAEVLTEQLGSQSGRSDAISSLALAAPRMILDRGYRVGSVQFLETSYDDANDGAVAAVHESAFGTNRTSRAGLAMSVDWGIPVVAFRGRQDHC
jgi:hypothetical protein